jgi:adenylate cyclase
LALDEYAEAFRARSHKKGIALGVTRIGVHAGPGKS